MPAPAPAREKPHSREPASSRRPTAPARRLGWEQPPPITGGAAGDAPLVSRSRSRQASAHSSELLPTLFNGPASVIGFVLAALALALDFLRHVTTVVAAAGAKGGAAGGAVKSRSSPSAASVRPGGAPSAAAPTSVPVGGVPARVAALEQQAAASAAALVAARRELAVAKVALRIAESRSTAEREAEAAAVAEATVRPPACGRR